VTVDRIFIRPDGIEIRCGARRPSVVVADGDDTPEDVIELLK
jgi:hypothetical protein